MAKHQNSMYACMYVRTYVCMCVSICLSVCLSVYLSIYLSIYLSMYICMDASTYACCACVNYDNKGDVERVFIQPGRLRFTTSLTGSFVRE